MTQEQIIIDHDDAANTAPIYFPSKSQSPKQVTARETESDSPRSFTSFEEACRSAAESGQPLHLSENILDLQETIVLRGRQHLKILGISRQGNQRNDRPPSIAGSLHSLFLLNNSSRLTLENLYLNHIQSNADCRQVGAVVNLRYKASAVLKNCESTSQSGFCCWAVQKSRLRIENCVLSAPLRSAVVCFGAPKVEIAASTISNVGVHGICARGSNGCVMRMQDSTIKGCAVRGLYAYAHVAVEMNRCNVTKTLRSDMSAVEVCNYGDKDIETKKRGETSEQAKPKPKPKPKKGNNHLSESRHDTSLIMRDCHIIDNSGIGVRIRGNVHTNDIETDNTLRDNGGGDFLECTTGSPSDKNDAAPATTKRDNSGSSFRQGDWWCPSCRDTIVPGSKGECLNCGSPQSRGTPLTTQQVLEFNQGNSIDNVMSVVKNSNKTDDNLSPKWYFDADKDSGMASNWVQYDLESSRRLENAYQRYFHDKNEHLVALSERNYEVDFHTMQQINIETQFPRCVRRQCGHDDANTDIDVSKSLLRQFQSIVNEPMPSVIPEPPVQVLPWLYLGPRRCLEDLDRLQNDIGITHVLSMNAMQPEQRAQELYYTLLSHGIDHCYVPALDILGYPLLPKLWEECRAFLEPIYEEFCESVENGQVDNTYVDKDTPHTNNKSHNASFPKVFVHCEAGINRSGTIVAAAMMYFAKTPLLDAVRHLKRQRGIIMTNATFQEQLVAFANERE